MSDADRLAALPAEKRRLLEARLRIARDAVSGGGAGALRPRARPDGTAPLSFAQQRQWLLERMDPGTATWNMPVALRLRGALHVPALERALDALRDRHESLRTTFAERGGAAVQVVHPFVPIPLPVEDLSHLDGSEREAEAMRRAQADMDAGFALAAGPLFRARLLRLAAADHALLLCMHHIVSDGWSLGVMERELAALYAAFAAGAPNPLPPPALQYADFAAWQREWLSGDRLDGEVEFWRRALAGAPPALALPTDHPRPPVKSARGARVSVDLPHAVAERLRALARGENATLFAVLLAALRVVLTRWSGDDDVVIGTPVAGRTRMETEALVGYFVNTLALRTPLSGDPPFRALLRREAETALSAFSHQELPFDRVVDELKAPRDPSRTPLFQVMLALRNAGEDGLRLPGLAVEPMATELHVSRFDLTFEAAESDGEINLVCDYDAALFEPSTARALLDHLALVLHRAAESPDATLSAVATWDKKDNAPRVAPNDPASLLWDKKDNVSERSETVVSRFLAAAARTPDAPALAWRDGGMTYAELEMRSAALAAGLRARGAGPETVAGVFAEWSPELVIALLGVMRSGAAYLPLDASLPLERIGWLLGDTHARIVVTTPALRDSLPDGGRFVALVDAAETADRGDWEDGEIDPDSAAWIVHTSGTTGAPKGVVVPYGAVAAHLAAVAEAYGLAPEDRTLGFAALSFDPSLEQVLAPLAVGASVALRDAEPWTPEELARRLPALGVTVANLPTPYWHQLVREPEAAAAVKRSVRLLVAGGEAMHPDAVRAWDALPGGAALLNAYGPTEAVVTATFFPVRDGFAAADPARVPIGAAIAGREPRVVDAMLRAVPNGAPGELCLGGPALARGYLRAPALTAERFVPDPFSREAGARMYRTGDRVRWCESAKVRQCESINSALPHPTLTPMDAGPANPVPPPGSFGGGTGEERARERARGGAETRTADSCDVSTFALSHSRTFAPSLALDLLGRTDAQVKISGARVEPGEVEAALRALPDVAECAVAARADASGEMRLAAYVVPRGELDAAAVRAALAARLPAWLVPSAIVPIGAIPRTATGKIDRRALPPPDFAAASARGEPPVTEDERMLAAIWAEVLGADAIAASDNFFERGGHSLMATQVVSRVRSLLGVELPMRAVFESPVLRDQARRLGALRGAGEMEQAGDAAPARTEAAGALPLSFAQERLWFIDRMEPGSAAYNVPAVLDVTGPLDVAALERALGEIVRRHEPLRTVFAIEGDAPVQVVQPFTGFHLPVTDLSRLPAEVRELETERALAAEARAPFDLAAGPVFRARLIRQGEREHVLSLVLHHIATDAWSGGIILRELEALYDAFRRGQPSPLPPLPMRYAEFAARQRQWLSGPALERQLEFWRARLAGAPALLELPADRPRPAVQDTAGALLPFVLPADAATLARAAARREGATLFMVLLAAFQALLHRWTGEEDVVVGTPIANRARPELEGLAGFFGNTLALRGDLSGDPTFAALLRRVRDATLDAYAHPDVPFEKLVDALKVPRSLSHAPLFQVMLTVQNTPAGDGDALGEARLRPRRVETATSRFDLTLILFEAEDGRIRGWAEYATALFDESTIERLTRHLGTLLREAAASPGIPISHLSLLSGEERGQLLRGLNRTDRPRAAETAHALVAAQAARTPDAAAIEHQGERVTYREMEARANRLAHRLRRLGVGPDARVAVAMERSVEMVIATLAVAKAGGCCVAVDPAYPADRVAYMLADSRAAVVLTTSDVAARLASSAARVLRIDAEREEIAREPADDPRVEVDPENLFYVLYTSGSTGRPKGAALPHRAVANLLRWQIERWGDAAPVRTLQFASLSFDVAFQEIYATLASGGTLVLIDDDTRRDPEALMRHLREHRIERLFLPFAALQNLVEGTGKRGQGTGNGDPASSAAHLPDLREVITAGEALRSTPQLRAFFRANPQAALENQYGPSETHVVSAQRVEGDPEAWPALPPIGAPVDNTRLYVLDARMHPVPLGVPGELYAGGASLARGYLGRPALTAERFVPDPFGPAGGRLYRTGDRVRWCESAKVRACESNSPARQHPTLAQPVTGPVNPVPPPGSFGGGTGEARARERANDAADAHDRESRDEPTLALSHSRTFALQFLGRTDFQVKLRGFRVEPGEIEAALTEHPSVAQAAVVVRGDGAGKRLAAYVVPAAGAAADVAGLRAHLAGRLPEYMVPAAWRVMDALPLTPSGKLDRRALPEPDAAAPTAPMATPKSATERAVARVWCDVLAVDAVGLDENFFEIGGHSLLLVALQKRLRDALDAEISVIDLFRFPTVRAQAAHIASQGDGAAAGADARGDTRSETAAQPGHDRAAMRREMLRRGRR
ncbi:non-ribosomal peptide synthetase [Longimicrobium sp.]|uniref:non-ribosomal peptide synthetase n=1 Tax=Longimicrobium sp. TaxID=2029185 RepID=UPI002C9361EA|nr:non-ribosomal peptide synthetase [Longimicrobium sp.]HSU17608.1 amino acid adenylation domain-containing protein [Longimicrobium sp.]